MRRADERDAIVIRAMLPPGVPDARLDEVRSAAVSGGVVSRIRMGSTVEVKVVRGR